MAGARQPVPLEVAVGEVARLRADGAPLQLLDVREKWETDICAIEGSVRIPMGQVPGRVAELARDRPLVVLCHHGGRSMQVTRWLRGQGFDNAVNMAGGIDLWARQIERDMATY